MFSGLPAQSSIPFPIPVIMAPFVGLRGVEQDRCCGA